MKDPHASEANYVNHKSSVTEQFADYNPKHLADMSVAAMIRTIAQMKSARRGHDTQGHLKKVNIDSSAEGYSNYMAPMRMQRVSSQFNQMPPEAQNTYRHTYNEEILRPATDTYLTTEWDEFTPFPNTWKIRFDGFGKSDYSKDKDEYGLLHQLKIPVDALAGPPWYQPQGPSHYGGTFADVSCVCNVPGKECHCKDPLSKEGKSEEKDGQKQKPLTAAETHTLTFSKGCGVGV
jgi:hypothetical protein